MAYSGYLIKIGGSNGTDLPMKYIKAESYKSTPDQRMENKAARDTTGVLHRTTVAHKATKIEFETPPITNADVSALNTLFSNAYTDALQRRLTIQFYDEETDSYREADCYMPDVQYNINRIDQANYVIYYNPIRFAFIEY